MSSNLLHRKILEIQELGYNYRSYAYIINLPLSHVNVMDGTVGLTSFQLVAFTVSQIFGLLSNNIV